MEWDMTVCVLVCVTLRGYQPLGGIENQWAHVDSNLL